MTTESNNGEPSAKAKSWTRRVVRLAAIVILTYVGVCVLVSLLQSKLIYFPSREYHSTPADVGLSFEDLTLTTDDGLGIAAWYVPRNEAKGTVIFCHGNAGNMADRLFIMQFFHKLGYHVFIFDYRGYGRSEGQPEEEGTYLDALAAWRFVQETKNEPPSRIVIVGRSLGGAVAIDLALRHPPAALVVEATFTSLTDVGRFHYPLLPVRWLLRYRYESIDKVSRLDCPKQFYHGRDDTLIPLENGRKLFEAAAEPKEFIETPGGHNSAGFAWSSEYTERLAMFLDEAIQAGNH